MDDVYGLEFDLVNVENEHVRLSPRAIDQGWDTQLKKDLQGFRMKVTEAKKKALFDVS